MDERNNELTALKQGMRALGPAQQNYKHPHSTRNAFGYEASDEQVHTQEDTTQKQKMMQRMNKAMIPPGPSRRTTLAGQI